MKRVLSVLLAITMVLTSTVFAAPSVVGRIETADEVNSDAETNADDASLSGIGYKVVRGINMLTGSKGALTGENYSTYGGIFNTGYADTTVSAAVNPKDSSDKVFVFNVPGNSGRGGNYVNFSVQFGPYQNGSWAGLSNYINHKYMYVAFDVMKEVVDSSSGYTAGDSFWIMNSTVASADYSFFTPAGITPSTGWQHFSKVCNLMLTNQEEGTSTIIEDPNQIIFHTYVAKNNVTDVNFYFDNMIIAPAYKVTYYNKAGTQVVKEEYIAQDASGNLLTEFLPAGFVSGRASYSGWSETVGGIPVTTAYILDENRNSDFVFYATEETDAFNGATLSADAKLDKLGSTATVTANLVGDPDVDADKVTWYSSNESVITVNKNKDGKTATLRAVGEGTSTITYSYEYATGSTATVTGDFEVAIGAKTDAVGLNTDVYEYITVNVTSTQASTVTVKYTTDVSASTTVTINVPAGAANMDVYKDMSGEANWEGKITRFQVTAGTGVTVNNTKLWATLSTDLALKFNSESTFIGTPGSSLNIGAEVDCDLEGVYDKTYTWTTNVTNNCATVTEENDGSLTITAGENADGFVTVTATSNDTSENVSITRRIFVKTGVDDGSKAIGYTWNFNDTQGTKNWYNGGGHHAMSTVENGTLTLVRTAAKLNGASSTSLVNVASTTDGYTLTAKTSGSYAESGQNSVEFSMSDYPYFCFKAKTTNPGTYAVKGYFTADGVSHAESRAKSAILEITDEYQIFALDLTSIANSADLKGKNYGGIMFVNQTDSVIDASTINSSNVASSPLKYSSYKPIIIDEVFFANYDASKTLEVGVNLTADKTNLTGEGIFTLTSEVFSNKAVTNADVVYSADSDIVTVFDNGDGTATVTPVGNGTVTITAKSVLDETATDSVTLTISGVQKKLVAYDLSMVSLGNSYLCHGYAEWFNKDAYNGWINADDEIRGMAASEPDLDYFGRIQYYINNNFNCSLKAERFANNQIEIAWKKGLANQSDASNHEGFDYTKAKNAILDAMTAQLAYIESEQTNIITIQLAENAQFGNYGEIAAFFYDTVFSAIDEVRPEESVVVVITPFGTNAATSAEIAKALEYGFCVANCTDMTDKKWQAFDQYPDFNNPNSSSDFRSHPGDLGMDEIGKRVFAQLEGAIPSTITANYIYVPESISITGGNAITADEGTLQLGISAEPSENSTTNVFWSVDNENVATIDDNGLLTAVNNGTVNVKAVCAYDSEVTATLAVTVSGQVPAYTLTYAAGSMDTVTNLPAADAYAKGTYTLSTVAPERNGYKFLGWALTSGGTPVKTVEMTSDKTVYATWALAYEWNFDTEGDMEGVSFGGFHTYVRYEELPAMVVGTVTSYGDGVTVFDNTLLLDSDSYNEFVVRLQPTQATAEDTLNLTITSTSGTYEYSVPMTKTSMEEYIFDLSDVTGTITGFLLKPSVIELSLYIDYMRFQKGAERVTVTEDTTVDNLTVTEYTKLSAVGVTYTVNNAVSVSGDATLYLEAGGTYVFAGGLTGNVEASPNANVIITGNAPEGYVQIDIGARQSNSNVRYAEIDGEQFEIRENNDLYGVITDKNLLVQIVEKAAASEASLAAEAVTEDVVTSYYHVDASSEEYTALPMGNYMKNVEGKDIRVPDEKTNNKVGLRFKAAISPSSKKATEYKITEYGYIIGLEETLEAKGEQLNFSASKYVYGKAYVSGEYDKVFDSTDDNYHVFTGVLYGAPESCYGKNLVAKTYTKVTVGSDNYVIYGEPMVANFFEIAQALDKAGNLSDEAQAIVDEILDKTLGPDIGFDWGEI